MAREPRGWGAGWRALVGSSSPPAHGVVIELSCRPHRRRTRASRARRSTREALDELAESIAARRRRAADHRARRRRRLRDRSPASAAGGPRRRAGLRDDPGAGAPRPTTATSLILALVENVAREDLNAVEQARAYAALSDEFELSARPRSPRRVGRSRAGGRQHDAAARAARRRAGADRARRAHRGPRPRAAAGRRARTSGRAGAPGGEARPVGARDRGGRPQAGRRIDAAAEARQPRSPSGSTTSSHNLAVDAAWQSLAPEGARSSAARAAARSRSAFETPAELAEDHRPAARRACFLGRAEPPPPAVRSLVSSTAAAGD